MISKNVVALCIYDILKKYSDCDHLMSEADIESKLKIIYNVDMERRAIYRNIEALKEYGIEIATFSDNRKGYYLVDRDFEPSEIRLLCDTIASSDMIGAVVGKDMIKKLMATQSIYQGRHIKKTLFMKEEASKVNSQLFFNIDILNVAITQDSKISCTLMERDFQRQWVERETIILNPVATVWVENRYYLLAIPDGEEKIQHFRLDAIQNINVLEESADWYHGSSPRNYAEEQILMNGEKVERFEIQCNRNLWDELLDGFHEEMRVLYHDKEIIKVKIATVPSKMIKWIMQHLTESEILSPFEYREEIKRRVTEGYRRYWTV